MINGKIIKGIGGFYYVETADTVYECKARGAFRKKKITPMIGDNVSITINEQGENTIEEIFERKNSLIRPPLANIDKLFIISSIVDPTINIYNIDKLIAICEYKHIEPIIVFTKADLNDSYQKYVDIYSNAGFKTVICNNNIGLGAKEVKNLIGNSLCAFTGNTGVGKSSLLNQIDSRLNLETGETSKKLGRGKHTTRHCELFKIGGGYIADTPGFSSIDFEQCEKILKDDLPYCFREFNDYLPYCKFSTNCSHTNDKGCAVLQAVKDGKISESRHNSYKDMYNEVKDIKKWEIK